MGQGLVAGFKPTVPLSVDFARVALASPTIISLSLRTVVPEQHRKHHGRNDDANFPHLFAHSRTALRWIDLSEHSQRSFQLRLLWFWKALEELQLSAELANVHYVTV